MNTQHQLRDGFALPVALLAMIVIGALVTGGFYASSQETRISTSTDMASRAFYVAEYGLEEAVGTWKNQNLADVAVDTTFPAEAVLVNGDTAGTYELSVRRLGNALYLMSSEGVVTQGQRQATRQVGMVVRTTEPIMPAQTSLAIFGGLKVGGNSNIHGDDSGGPGCVPGDTVTGVTAYDSTLVDQGNRDRIQGNPPVEQNSALDTAALSQFGDIDLDMLKSMATKTYAAGDSENGMAPVEATTANGDVVCVDTVRSNWGDPDGTSACSSEFPIIHAEGDLHLKTGKGQGILIVEGDLKASGNFDFYGVVIVLGELETTGTGNHFEGSVIVQGHGQLDSESTTLGNSLVQYSRCRVDRALNATLRPRPLSSRAWLDFTAVTAGST